MTSSSQLLQTVEEMKDSLEHLQSVVHEYAEQSYPDRAHLQQEPVSFDTSKQLAVVNVWIRCMS